MPKITYDGDIKIIDYGDRKEWVYPSGLIFYDGGCPEDVEDRFYKNYNPGAARIRHKSSPQTLIDLVQKQQYQEE